MTSPVVAHGPDWHVLAQEARELARGCARLRSVVARAGADESSVRTATALLGDALRALEAVAGSLESSAEGPAPGPVPADGDAAHPDPRQALLLRFADALVAADLDECARLAEEWPSSLSPLQTLRELLGEVPSALAERHVSKALPAVRVLAHAAGSDARRAAARERQATLHLVAARIELRERRFERAMAELRAARSLIEDRVPYHAALSEYFLARGEAVHAEDRALRAVDLGPGRPEGHVALGRWAETQGEDPTQHYAAAALAATSVAATSGTDPLRGLSAGLAPTPPRLLHALGEHAAVLGDGELALRAVDSALVATHEGESDDSRLRRLAEHHELRARALALLEAPAAERAAELVEAGKHSAWANDIAAARARLEAALALDPDNADAHYTLCDVLRTASATAEPPYVDTSLLGLAWDEWEHAVGLRPPTTAWEHRVRASLAENAALVPGADRHRHTWDAVAHLEQAVAVDPSDSWAYSGLGRLYGVLELYACGLQATDCVEELTPGVPETVEDRVILLTNADRPAEALQALEAVEDQQWAETVRAAVLVDHGARGDIPSAIATLESRVASAEAPVWMWDYLITAYRLVRRSEDARATAQALWEARERYDGSDRDSALALASALMVLGRFAEARDRLDAFREDPTGRARRVLKAGMCRLALGDATAADEIYASIETERAGGDWRAALDDVALVEEALDDDARDDIGPILARVRTLVEQRHRDGPDRRPAEDELGDVLAPDRSRLGRSASAHPAVARMAALAGLARLARESGRWEDAVAHTTALLEHHRGALAHASAGVLAGRLEERGDTALAQGECGVAAAAYSGAIAVLDPDGDPAAAAELHLRRAVATCCQRQGEPDADLARSVALLDGDPARAGAVLATVTGDRLRSPDDFWAVLDGWSAAAGRAADARLAAALRFGVEALGPALDRILDGGERVEAPEPVPPLVVELGAGLIPEDTSASWPLLGETVPELRRRLSNELGFTLPAVRVRAAYDLEDDEYAVLIDEAVAATGHVDLTSSTAEELAGLRTVAEHLHRTVLAQIEELFGVEEFEALWDDALGDPDGAVVDRLVTLVPDTTAKVRSARLLGRLLADSIPVSGWNREILAAAAEGFAAGEATLDAAEDRVRLAIRARLPGNAPQVRRHRLPAEWDRALSLPSGECATATTPAAIHDMLRRLDLCLDELGADPDVALVTTSATGRRRLRELLRCHRPSLRVQTVAETVAPDSVQPLPVPPPASGEQAQP